APRVKRPYLQAQSALELVAVGGPLLRKNWSKPHLSEEIDPHFIGEFCDFPGKLCEFYLGMLQSFPPWKSAFNDPSAHPITRVAACRVALNDRVRRKRSVWRPARKRLKPRATCACRCA